MLATCFPYSPNVSLRGSGAVGSYLSVSAISGTTWFGRACKWRVGIWLTGNLRVEVVAGVTRGLDGDLLFVFVVP